MIKKTLTTLAVLILCVLPLAVFADDFDDFEEDSSEEEEEEAEEEEAVESSSAKKAREKSESDAAMRDLMGDSGEEEEAEEPKESKKSGKSDKAAATGKAPAEETAPANSKSFGGFKPILLVKGGMTFLGNYRQNNVATGAKLSAIFGSVDEGLVGGEYMGEHVIARGLLNVRTDNPFINNGNNPLAKINLHSVQNGAANMLYEAFGGIKFFDVFIKAGKMVPEYGLMDTYQNLGMGFTTPYLTRSLIAVEGFIPESDAGLAIGYNGIVKNDHNIFAGLSLGTGTITSDFWNTDKTIGLYGRVGYGFKDYVKAAIGFQYRTDQFNNGTVKKSLSFIGIGVHAQVAVKGFEMPITFDYTMFNLVNTSTQKRKSASNMLLSVAPGYAYHFNHDWIDKVGLALRFDYVQGIFANSATAANYLETTSYKSSKGYMRIGVTANFFTKELAGVRGMAGLTFLMQPKAKIATGDKDYGFTTLMLSAGAEY